VTSHLIAPHGGTLVDLVVSPQRAAELKDQSRDWASWDLTPRQLCDLELLANGGFSPLTGFMNKADYDSVCDKMRLASGTLWPMPITLDVAQEFADKLKKGDRVALRDAEGVMLAVITVEDIWTPDREAEGKAVFGTTDKIHPAVSYLRSTSAARSKPCSSRSTTTTERSVTRRSSSAKSSPSAAGPRSSPSKPATRCTARTTSSRSAPPRNRKPTCWSTRSSA
jgi:hypothetical protein